MTTDGVAFLRWSVAASRTVALARPGHYATVPPSGFTAQLHDELICFVKRTSVPPVGKRVTDRSSVNPRMNSRPRPLRLRRFSGASGSGTTSRSKPGSTIWRWLAQDAIRPWQHRSWVFPRDPQFAQKAAPVLDLYQRIWEGQPLEANEFVMSADEKTSIQARHRIHPTAPP